MITGLLTLFLAAAASVQQPDLQAPAIERLAIVGADVLPMTGPARLHNQTVLVDGDRIAAVGPERRIRIPAGYRIIRARGLVLMPGLVDMHIHLSPDPGRPGDSTQRALAIALANGVTTVRVMLGQPAHTRVREAIERGELPGPRIYAASPAIHQGNTRTTDEARQAVRAAHAAGFDLIKSHQLTDVEVWQAMQDEAARLGVPVAGHVTNAVGLSRALAARQEIEHLDGAFASLMPPGLPLDFGQFIPPAVIDAAEHATDAQVAALARSVADAHNYQVPTLAVLERAVDLETPFEELAAPDQDYLAGWILDQWRQRRAQLPAAGWTPELVRRFISQRRRIVRAYYEAGVPVMAGSDTPQPFQIWGFGLIREIESLSAAGLGPTGALRAATVVPRDYFRSLQNGGSSLGWRADFGTVEVGARADLILLRGDPSRNLAALHAPQAVIAGGRMFDRNALDALLARASANGKEQPRPPAGP
jgi:imidazolonepropionase-like amidohydrolase